MKYRRGIGFLTPGWPGQSTPNGIATAVYYLTVGMEEAGYKPIILTYNVDGPCSENIPVVFISGADWTWYDRLRYKLGDEDVPHRHFVRQVAIAVKAAIASEGLEVLIMEETNGWAALLQPLIPIPIIVTLHGPWTLLKTMASLGASEDAKREKRERRGFQAAAGIIAPSHSVLAAVEETVPLPDTPKIILPNTLAVSSANVPSGALPKRDILFVGRFDFLKGADTVLGAFARLVEKHPDVRLTFAGPDNGLKQADGSVTHMDDALSALPAKVRAQITYKGAVGREEIASLRATHAIALITSRYENLNYSLLEAMAAGQAIVCTKVGGPAEVLTDEVNALMVPPGDCTSTTVALDLLINDAELAKQLGETAMDTLERDFNPANVAVDTANFVDTILNA